MTQEISSNALDVLFVDDEIEVRRANLQTLELAGLEALACATAEEALRRVEAGPVAAVVSDVRLPGIDGLELLRRVRVLDPDLPVILVTGHGDVAMAVEAMRDGAYDFIEKPYPAERLLDCLRRALDKRRLVLENRRLRQALADDATGLIGATPAMERLRRLVAEAARAEVDVLILGETGAGKEVVAAALHRLSRRAAGRFVAINCGALPEMIVESELFGHRAGAFTGATQHRIGRIEHAGGGTLFLDEIESMSLTLQVKLLRVLEQRAVEPLGSNELRPVDLRVVAATKRDLAEAVRERGFRQDLYYRLNVVTIAIPPLRERRADIPLLFEHFLDRAALRLGRERPAIPAAMLQHLMSHDWPGNVRELAHFADRFVLGFAEPVATPGSAGLAEQVEDFERALLIRALSEHGGDVRAAAEALGVPRKTFYDKLQRHRIDPAAYRSG